MTEPTTPEHYIAGQDIESTLIGPTMSVRELIQLCDLADIDAAAYAEDITVVNPTPENVHAACVLARYAGYLQGYENGVLDIDARVTDAVDEQLTLSYEFFSALAHNFRTPLTTARGFSELMRDGVVEQGEDNYTVASERVISALTRMENALASMMRLAFERELGEPPDEGAIRKFFEELRPVYGDGRDDYEISIEISPETEGLIINNSLLEEALLQTLSNAIKYSSPAEAGIPNIIIRIEVVGNVQDGYYVMYEQENSTDKELPTDFTLAYSQFGIGHKTLGKSLGVGLQLLKRICDREGVRIDARQDEVTNNVRFRFFFPVQNRI